ncbi:ABC transporter permease [Treponema socranskii]|uniref:ABC transporter permease n=1 Tax=Treponema socranskii TaxID=53419 RepID=UPI003D6FFEAA
MTIHRKRFEIWTIISVGLFLAFLIFFIYPIGMLLRQAFTTSQKSYTFDNFIKFFSKPFYYNTILNSFKVSVAAALVSLVVGIVFAYFYSFYRLKGARFLAVASVLCCMSAPFIGAYSWILLMGRSGAITLLLKNIGINTGNIYGFGGILLVQATKLYPLVFIYMNGMFGSIDNSLMEASSNLGCTGIRRFFLIVLSLSMPTILAAALLVFMRAFADFGTPLLIGEGYRTFTVEIYKQFLSETGADYGFASAISVIAIVLTAVIFWLQKYATKKFSFTMNALHPVEKKSVYGIGSILMHFYCYGVVAISLLPQLYIIYISFRKTKLGVFQNGYSLESYRLAITRLLFRAIKNTTLVGVIALAVIILFAVLISYLVVRRPNPFNHLIDTVSMLPYIMPGSVIAIALVIGFGRKPIVLTGTLTIMIIAVIIRRLPYTTRSATATLVQISMSIEEAALSLGSSKMNTFFKITVPMMSSGIVSGAILSWVSIVTEVSSAAILYNNRSITLTVGTYAAVSRGNVGEGAAFAAVTTVLTALSLLVYIKINKNENFDI